MKNSDKRFNICLTGHQKRKKVDWKNTQKNNGWKFPKFGQRPINPNRIHTSYLNFWKLRQRKTSFPEWRKLRECVIPTLKGSSLNRKEMMKEGTLEHEEERKHSVSKNIVKYNSLSFSCCVFKVIFDRWSENYDGLMCLSMYDIEEILQTIIL